MSCDHECTHLSKLDPMPSEAELTLLRKGKRKRKLPEMSDGFVGEHSKLGRFSITACGMETICEWQTPGQEMRRECLSDLNVKKELESSRLAFGWLIASMFQLDGLHNVDAIPDPVEAMKAAAFFSKHKENWQHWALVPAGHMLLS